jgi:hypothetical protein
MTVQAICRCGWAFTRFLDLAAAAADVASKSAAAGATSFVIIPAFPRKNASNRRFRRY